MIRLFGAVLCISAGLLTGAVICLESKKRLECLNMLVMALELMHTELATNLTPIPALMRKVSESSKGCVKKLAEEVYIKTNELEKKAFEELWSEGVRNNLNVLEEKELQRTVHLGSVLGKTELAEQLSAISSLEKYLSCAAAEIEGSFPQLRKTSFGISLAVGALVTIVLL